MDKRRFSRFLIPVLCLALALPACSTAALFSTSTPMPTPTPHPLPTLTPEPLDTGWQALESGAEQRLVRVAVGSLEERLVLVRLDPARFRFRVRYTPGAGQAVSQWAAQTPALLVVNGGYFTPEYQATGLLVSDGQTYGLSYGDFAGMFAVLPGGRVQLRWLAAQPYDAQEMLLEAVQSFPMLVKPGGVLGFPPEADDGRTARRTVIAQDRAGRILLIAAPRGAMTLHDMARWLVESDLDLDVALNLDGGQSTGLYLSTGNPLIHVDSLVAVPAVIVVERR
ncbi:MAG: phosphodiester glycosidase family protein [Anaerolineae bacterium]|nr:phosphodiester glycosidase family protein [Anaerolineae bacterium]